MELYVVYYYVIDKSWYVIDQDFFNYVNLLKEFEMYCFSVNGREFMGILKVVIFFENGGDNYDQKGYNIFCFEYE